MMYLLHFNLKNKSRDITDSGHVENMKNENINLKHIIKSYEERNISITELERKIREKQAKHEKELKDLEARYKEVNFSFLNKKLKNLSKKLRNDDNSKNSVLLTKDNTRVELTVDSHLLTDRVLLRNTSNLGITERKREEYSSNNIDKKKKSDISKKLSEVF